MAKTYKITMNFEDAAGKNIAMNYAYSKSEQTPSVVKAVMEAIIANGSIFKRVPVKKKSAYVTAMDQTDIDVA